MSLMTFTFGVNIKIISLPLICVWTKSSVLFDMGMPNLEHGCTCINMRQHVIYTHDLNMTLTFDLYVDDLGGNP